MSDLRNGQRAKVASSISSRRLNARNAAEDDYEKRRAKLVEVAAMVFREKGFNAANVDDIAKRAGIDRASIYYYYKGKKELFREMVEQAITGNVERAEEIASTADLPSAKLRRLILALFQSYERHYPYLYVYVQEDMTRLMSDQSTWSRNVRSLSKRFDVATTSIIKDGLESAEFRSSGDAKVLAAGVIGMCNWSHRWFEPGRHNAEDVANALADMVLQGLVGH
jgi:TetR/AcrR family transcriptional regulator, cholesterol catabolism regulator